MFLYDIFSNLCSKAPRVTSRKPDKRTGKIYKTVAFKSLNIESTGALNYYSELFYIFKNEGKRKKFKIVPDNIIELLTPRALAFWIMDDGAKLSSYQNALHTRSYTYEEVIILLAKGATSFIFKF